MNKDDINKNLDRINFWITNVDVKISFILAFLGVFFTLFFTSDWITDSYKDSMKTLSQFTKKDLQFVVIVGTILASLGLVIFLIRAFLSVLNAIMARINIQEFKDQGVMIDSNIFFGSIASKTYEEFAQQMEEQTDQDSRQDLYSQVYMNSKICTLKFQYYNKAIRSIRWALLFFVSLIICFYVHAILA